jgi:hypothetical protein
MQNARETAYLRGTLHKHVNQLVRNYLVLLRYIQDCPMKFMLQGLLL